MITISICSVFLELGYSFDVSHLVDKLIVKRINENVMDKFKPDNFNLEYSLGIFITTGVNVKEIEVMNRPSISKKYKSVDYTFKLPHIEIDDKEDNVILYVNNFFEALKILFDRLKLSLTNEIELTKQKVIGEIYLNKVYSINNDDDVLKMLKKKNLKD